MLSVAFESCGSFDVDDDRPVDWVLLWSDTEMTSFSFAQRLHRLQVLQGIAGARRLYFNLRPRGAPTLEDTAKHGA